MKLTVITGKDGTIVATAGHAENGNPDAGEGGPVAGPAQSVHVIDLPKELENTADADGLHRQLKSYLGHKK